MTVIRKSKVTAEQARQKYAQWSIVRSRSLVDLIAPSFEDWWDGDPDFEGWVPRDKQKIDMTVTVDEVWPEYADVAGLSDWVVLEIKKEHEGDDSWVELLPRTEVPGPIDLIQDFPMDFTVDKRYFSTDGRYNLRYAVYLDNGTRKESIANTFVIDSVPPHHGGQAPNLLLFKDATEIENEGITQAYLNANQTRGVPLVVPDYNDEQPGDWVKVYRISESTPGETLIYEDPYVVENNLRLVFVPVSYFSSEDDGVIAFKYRLVDKVGNEGSLSDQLSADLLTKPLPVAPLEAPKVPLADLETPKLIDREDVLAGVDVTVKLYTNWLPIDKIGMVWGDVSRDDYRVGQNPSDPIVVPMPHEVIRSAYDAVAGTGEKSTVVKYSVWRGNREFPSEENTIFVDLSYVGPINPTDPEIVNPTLTKLDVYGGGVTPVLNTLRIDDIGLEATASFVIPADYDDVGLIKVYWGDLPDPVATTTVIPDEGDPVSFGIAWADIEKVPGILVPVYYTISAGPTDNNPQKSEPTLVDVRAAVPIRLGTPTFPDVSQDGGGDPILNCYSFIGPDQHVKVTVPENTTLLKAGDPMTITWQAYDNRLPATLNPVGTAWSLNIPSLTEEQVSDGFTVSVEPFAAHIEPVRRSGSVKVTYTSGAYTGEVYIKASSVNAGGTCPINP